MHNQYIAQPNSNIDANNISHRPLSTATDITDNEHI
jgi:hypothetical protein